MESELSLACTRCPPCATRARGTTGQRTPPSSVLCPSVLCPLLMQADRLEFLAPRVGDRGLAAVGQQDGRAVGRMQRVEQRPRRKLGSLWELPRDVFGTDGLDIGDLAAAEQRKRLRR